MSLPELRSAVPTSKAYRRGTHRSVAPEKTLARIERVLPALGITRLANVTGLDHIGIPVYMACRPNARSLAVFQGKGLDNPAARASAAMEAIETFHAETIDLPLRLGSYEELRYTHDLVDVARLPYSKAGLYDPLEPILWIEGRDLTTGVGRWLPFELVHTNYTLPGLTGSGAFVANTNGLASGNTILEALCHGLCEVVERDAVTLWKLMAQPDQDRRTVDPESVDDSACREILALFQRAEIDVVIWDVTSDVGVATFLCLIAGRNEATGAPEFGAGCHLCRSVALSRALTEAAQARTTYIVGSRDDITAAHYTKAARRRRHRMARNIIADHRPQRSYGTMPNLDQNSFDEDLNAILAALASASMNEAYAIDLTKPSLGIPVVRVVVPGLETALESPEADYVPGERAMAVLESRR